MYVTGSGSLDESPKWVIDSMAQGLNDDEKEVRAATTATPTLCVAAQPSGAPTTNPAYSTQHTQTSTIPPRKAMKPLVPNPFLPRTHRGLRLHHPSHSLVTLW